jgi:hypothetical protein
LRCGWSLDSREGVTYPGALQFEDRCDAFWESATPIGSDMPSLVVLDEREAGMVYPMTREVDDVCEGGSAK